ESGEPSILTARSGHGEKDGNRRPVFFHVGPFALLESFTIGAMCEDVEAAEAKTEFALQPIGVLLELFRTMQIGDRTPSDDVCGRVAERALRSRVEAGDDSFGVGGAGPHAGR